MLPQCKKSKIKGSATKRSKFKIRKTESLIWLNYLVVLHRLAVAAQEDARANKQGSVSAENIKAVQEWQLSEECMCRLRNIAMRDYQESVTTKKVRLPDRQTLYKVIPMCRYASQATQK